MSRGLRGLGGVIAVAWLGAAAACGPDEAVPEASPATDVGIVRLSSAQVRSAGIRTAVLESRPITRVVAVPGTIDPPDTAQAVIGSVVEGRVVAVRVLPGDVVREGEPLVEIHSHELSDAAGEMATAQAQLDFHRRAFERSEELLDAGAVSLEEVERRRADFQSARAELTRAEAMVEHLHPSSAGNVTAVATRGGTIFSVNARVGQVVLPGDPLVEMGSTAVLWVTAYVPEQTAGMLTAGDTVRVRFGAPAAEVSAHLVRAGDFVDAASRSVEMRFELDSIPRGVRPGSFATVDVSASESIEGVEVAEDAALRLGDRDVVFVAVGEGEYRAVTVGVEPMSNGRVAISGVPEGSEVVVDGAYFLKAAFELAEETTGTAGPPQAGPDSDAGTTGEGSSR